MLAEDLVMSAFSMCRSSKEYRLLCMAIQKASLIYPYYPTFDLFCRNMEKSGGEAGALLLQQALAQAVEALWTLPENRKLFDQYYGYHLIERPSSKDFVYTMGGYVCRQAGQHPKGLFPAFVEGDMESAAAADPDGSSELAPAEKRSLTREELYEAYLAWLEGDSPCAQEEIFLCPVANQDVFEDETCVVNRLWYVVPARAGGRLRTFSFFEENLFYKDARGDLDLARSAYCLCQAAR